MGTGLIFTSKAGCLAMGELLTSSSLNIRLSIKMPRDKHQLICRQGRKKCFITSKPGGRLNPLPPEKILKQEFSILGRGMSSPASKRSLVEREPKSCFQKYQSAGASPIETCSQRELISLLESCFWEKYSFEWTVPRLSLPLCKNFISFAVSNSHRDKTRVQIPAKMFPHLKLCWLFMGPTLGFDKSKETVI